MTQNLINAIVLVQAAHRAIENGQHGHAVYALQTAWTWLETPDEDSDEN